MQTEKKQAVFFDIDGTIWNFKNEIPPSTVRAIRALRAGGHLAFLCSGRTRGYIRHPALLDIGFDGIISGCGTMLEYRGETLFYHRIPPELGLKAVTTARRHGFKPILEGADYLYFDDAEFGGDPYGEKLRRDLGTRLRSIAGHWGTWEFSKFSCDTRDCDQAACFAQLPEFDPIVHTPEVVELVPRGFDKGAGIMRLCRMIGWPAEDTVAFGDSFNDLEMFAACGRSVCMGNGVEAARAAADMVTAPMEQDGIWLACRELGLIPPDAAKTD